LVIYVLLVNIIATFKRFYC